MKSNRFGIARPHSLIYSGIPHIVAIKNEEWVFETGLPVFDCQNEKEEKNGMKIENCASLVPGRGRVQEGIMIDHEIVQGLRQGDKRTAEVFLDRFEGPLLRYFQVALSDPEAAEDATQETFLRFFRTIRAGARAPRIRSCQAFLFTIAHRLVIDQARAVVRHGVTVSLDAPVATGGDSNETLQDRIASSEDDPRRAAERQEHRELVNRAIRSLDPETREVVMLRHFDGLSGKEVSETLDLPPGTVWSRLHRGLERLREILEPQMKEPSRSGRKNGSKQEVGI
jgi:RNA polymerase sigma-70 factor (ECF subfamily)